jgi:hypothetical protein
LEYTSILLVLAAVGGARLAWRDQRTLAIMLVAYLPYLVFHLAFHQVADLRYSLPLVVPVAGLVVSGLRILGRTAATIASAVLIVASLAAAQPAIETFANGHPVFKALRAMQDAYAPLDAKPAVTMHHQIWWGMGRAFDWYRQAWTVTEGPFPGARETLAVTRHWLTGETRPMWFLAHPARTDLARFDPRTTTRAGDFLLASGVRRLVGDARSDEVVWWVIDRPDWMLGTGWSLTPELGGMTMADQAGPRVQPAQAFLRRTGEPIRVLVGGRHRGGAGSARARVTADVDGRLVHEWTVEPESWFVEWLELPEGTGAGGEPYAALGLGVTADEAGRPAPRLSFEQFDAVSEDEVAYALGHGWHELESDPESGRTWRWMSGLATIEVRHAGADVTLVLSGESRLGTFGWAPRVLVWAGRQELASFAPSGDFVRVIDVPVSALEAGSGVISISTDLTFAPTDLTDGPPARDSSLRLFGVEIVGRD